MLPSATWQPFDAEHRAIGVHDRAAGILTRNERTDGTLMATSYGAVVFIMRKWRIHP
jgi:hypothetical protein